MDPLRYDQDDPGVTKDGLLGKAGRFIEKAADREEKKRARAIEKFEAKNADLIATLRALGHELEFLVLASEGGPLVKLGCTRCGEELRGKWARRRGRGLTPETPCMVQPSGR